MTTTSYICDCGDERVRISGRQLPCLVCEAYTRIRTASSALDLHAFETLCVQAGRRHYPGLLIEAYCSGSISDDVVQACVGRAWCAAEFPDRALDWGDWRELFDVAGYTVDGRPEMRSTSPVVLYRAAPELSRLGHSWTADIDLARRFLTLGYRDAFKPVLWSVTVEPWRLLARLEDDRPGESQYVVETDGLAVEQMAGARS